MQAKKTLGVVETPDFESTPFDLAELNQKLDLMLRLMDEQLMLQRVGLLQDGHILRFAHSGMQDISLSLPNAQDDFVQRSILKARNFYEWRLLATVQGLDLIKEGTTVCDIGANIGNHSVFFGKVLGAKQVLAFEPQASVYTTLCRNLELNGMTDALAYNCLVGAKSGRGEVAKFNPRNLGSTSFTPTKDGSVPMVALDDLIDAEEMKNLGFIKIDAEGMQLDVLQGAKKVIKAKKPAIWLELQARDKESTAETFKLMDGLGYGSVQIGPNDHVFTYGK